MTGALRSQTVKRVRDLRARIDAMGDEVVRVAGDGRYTAEARAAEVKRLRGEMDALIAAERSTLAAQVKSLGVDRAAQRLREVTAVDPAAKTAAALSLQPVIAAAGTNPEGLLSAYRRVHSDPAARRLLEEVAAATFDAWPAGDYRRDRWGTSWNAVVAELADQVAPEEKAARAAAVDADALAAYVDDATQALTLDVVAFTAKLPDADYAARNRATGSMLERNHANFRAAQFEQSVDAPAGV